MKKYILILIGILPLVMNGQTYFYMETVSIAPNPATESDEIVVTITGMKSDPCSYLLSSFVDINANVVNIEMNWWNESLDPPFPGCIAVLVPDTLEIIVPPQSAGTYTLSWSGAYYNNDNVTGDNSFLVLGGVVVPSFQKSVDMGCFPLTVQFTNTSQNATSFNWNFGDGESSTEENPTHTYNNGNAGTYTVTLVASNNTSTESTSQQITLGDAPQPELGDPQVLLTNTNTILDAGDGYEAYLWSTGETTQTITVYGSQLNLGTNEITVTVTDELGCEGTDVMTIFVEQPTSLREPFWASKIEVVNPVINFIQIINHTNNFDVVGDLFSLDGKNLLSFNLNMKNNRIHVSEFSSGLYLLRFRKGSDFYYKKIIVL